MPAYWIAHLAEHLVEAGMPSELAELLCTFEFLRRLSAHVGLSYNAGSTLASLVRSYLTLAMEQSSGHPGKLVALSEHLPELAAGLDLWAVRGVGGPDKAASCKRCGAAGIIHGHVDLGGVECYDNYFSLCPNCYWAWHTEHFQQFMSADAPWAFNYATNTYSW
jgi:hypothetical protein